MYSACITRLHTATIQRYTSYIVDYTCIVYMYSAFAQGFRLARSTRGEEDGF